MRKFWKRLILILVAVIIVIVAIHVLSALTLDRRIRYREITYATQGIPQALDGYVIAFVVDTHDLKAAEMQAVVDRINARDVDLLLLGGDYRSYHAEPTLKILAAAKTKDGIYGVMGNHDLDQDLADNMPKYNMVFLYNQGLELKPGFFLAGVSDLRTHTPRVAQALKGAPENDFVLLLSHNPALALEHELTGVDLMLSGHTHGGLINFFGLWSPALALRNPVGNKLRSGWYQVGATDILVSNGVGYTEKIPRVFAWPEVIFITLDTTP